MRITAAAHRSARPITWLSSIVILLALFLLMQALPAARAIAALEGWIDGLGIWGPAVFTLIYAVATVLMLPGSALTLAAGAFFGLGTGMVVASSGATVGAAAAFLVSRHVVRSRVERQLAGSPRFKAVDRAIGESGWRIVALLRLSPAIPFNLQNYLYGATSIRFWPCVLASWIAMLPGAFMYVYIGYLARAGVEAASGARGGRDETMRWVLIGVGFVATVAVTVYVARLASRAVRQRAGPEVVEPEQVPPSSWPWGATVAAILAAVLIGLAATAQLNRDSLQRLVGRLLGPPRVTLTEAYDASGGGAVFDHSAFGQLLQAHVDDGGMVDYDGIARDPAALDRYIDSLADAPFDEMGRDEALALLINAYNAFTLRLVLDHRPIDSITSIPAAQRWDARRWTVAGRTWSLNQIEHEQIRPMFKEPRIHFALVCAAIGCPPLRTEPYVAATLDQQLADQARIVHGDERWFRFDEERGTVHLTKLYSPGWYGADFEQTEGSVLAFAARYAPALAASLEAGGEPRVEWLDYDWSLNARRR